MANDLELARAATATDNAVDREAFGRLVMEHERLLYSISRTMLRADADCRDAMQETVLAAWRGFGGLRQPRYFRTWLVRILINECNRQMRARRRFEPLADALEQPGEDEDVLAVRRAVEALPMNLRLVVALHYYEGFSTEEIARSLGIPQGTVKSRLSRAREQLKLSMKE